MKRAAASLVVLIALGGAAGAVEILKAEPPAGALPYRHVVYVDDGSCPKGQIKKLVGGNGSSVPRQRSCVDRPKN